MAEPAGTMRIDRFLWWSRISASRSYAQALAEGGHLRLNGRRIERSAAPVRVGDIAMRTPSVGAALSPDGRWLAYLANTTGRAELWVRRYPGLDGIVRISPNGAAEPVWSKNGRELFYLEDNTLMRVRIRDTGERFEYEPPVRLVQGAFLRMPQSPSFDHDLDALREKVAAGADRAITQMFFDNRLFLRHRDRVAARGVDVPLVPGVFPIHSFPAVARFAARCGATLPDDVARRFEGLDDDRQATHAVAADLAAAQIAELAEHGVEHVHLYTLNRAELALAVGERLGVVDRVRS